MKAHSDARVRPDGKPRAGQHSGWRQCRRHCPGEECMRRSLYRARSVATDQGRPEGDRNQHDLCGRIRIGQRSSDGAADADRGVTHMRHDFREQRQLGPDKGVLFQHVVFGRGTDRDRALLSAHEGELSEPRDVNEPPRTGQPHGHQRHQRLAPRDNTRFVCGGLVQHRAGLVEVRGTTIFERCGFQRGASVPGSGWGRADNSRRSSRRSCVRGYWCPGKSMSIGPAGAASRLRDPCSCIRS